MDHVHTVMDWTSKRNSEAGEQKLYRDLKPDGLVEIAVPSYGTLQLKTELLLCDHQLRILRGLLREWDGGKGVLQGHKSVQKAEDKLCVLLEVDAFREV